MTLQEFKDKYWNEPFERPDLIVEAAIKDDLKAADVTVYTNKGPSGNIYYTIRSTHNTLKKKGNNAILEKEVLSIEDSTFDQLKDRHWKYAQAAAENLSNPKSLFRMVFGYTEPGDSANQSSGIEMQKPIINKNIRQKR